MRPPDAGDSRRGNPGRILLGKAMRNITVAVADEVYARARVWAAEHDTSVSAVVQYMLSTLRTDWRARNFLAARAFQGVRRPLAPRHPAPPRPEKKPDVNL